MVSESNTSVYLWPLSGCDTGLFSFFMMNTRLPLLKWWIYAYWKVIMRVLIKLLDETGITTTQVYRRKENKYLLVCPVRDFWIKTNSLNNNMQQHYNHITRYVHASYKQSKIIISKINYSQHRYKNIHLRIKLKSNNVKYGYNRSSKN